MINKKRGISLIFSNKKGIIHDLFFNVFELILAFIVILSLLNFVSDVAEQTLFRKNYLARDISLLVNTLYAAPAKVEYVYDGDMKDMVIEFSENRIRVHRVDEKEQGVRALYLFGENLGAPFDSYPILTYDEKSTRMYFDKLPGGLGVR